MQITRKTNILIATKRRFVVRQAANERILCERCNEPMIRAQAAADFFGVSSRTIYRFIEQADVHFTETDVNQLYVRPISTGEAFQIQSAETGVK